MGMVGSCSDPHGQSTSIPLFSFSQIDAFDFELPWFFKYVRPRWLAHLQSQDVLDGDASFLHWQVCIHSLGAQAVLLSRLFGSWILSNCSGFPTIWCSLVGASVSLGSPAIGFTETASECSQCTSDVSALSWSRLDFFTPSVVLRSICL